MNFDSARLVFQIINLLILFAIIMSVVIVPAWIYKRVNSIEGLLKELSGKLDSIISSRDPEKP